MAVMACMILDRALGDPKILRLDPRRATWRQDSYLCLTSSLPPKHHRLYTWYTQDRVAAEGWEIECKLNSLRFYFFFEVTQGNGISWWTNMAKRSFFFLICLCFHGCLYVSVDVPLPIAIMPQTFSTCSSCSSFSWTTHDSWLNGCVCV